MSLRLPLTQAIEIVALTTAMQQSVPSLEGVTNHLTELEVRRVTGEFTPQEVALLQDALNAHDTAAERQRLTRQAAKRRAAPVSLKAATGFAELKQALLDLHGID